MPTSPNRIRPPTRDDLREIASEYYLNLNQEELEVFPELITNAIQRFDQIEEFSEPRSEIRYTDRDSGHRATGEDDPYNAFITKCEVQGSAAGPLSEYDVGLKDNIALAGVRMTSGSQVLEDFVPTYDATIVTRLLEAGATITGKLNMGDMSVSNDEFSAMNPARNPHDTDRMLGGSSTGSAVAVVSGDVDIAIGADQGGSIRLPAAWCGCVGHKPTFGLVPYTGVASAVPSLDHVGPMTTTVRDCAKTLDVVSGKDSRDPRQNDIRTAEYETALSEDPSDVTIGVLEEGFGMDEDEGFDADRSDERIDRCVRNAIGAFEAAGATVETISIPKHSHSTILGMAIGAHEISAMVKTDGVGRFAKGRYEPQYAEAFGKGRKANADDFHPRLKLQILTGYYLSKNYSSRYYAKVQNLRRSLTNTYDAALEDIDVLAMPTVQKEAPEIFDNPTLRKCLERPRGQNNNTMPFNVTGHPAISVPCGTVDGLPVGIQFVGNQFKDETVLRVAYAFEQNTEDVEIDQA